MDNQAVIASHKFHKKVIMIHNALSMSTSSVNLGNNCATCLSMRELIHLLRPGHSE